MTGVCKLSSAWIFVSHSNNDLDAVRRIRNELERRDANPILFFLKSVEDSDELDTLIKREINARNFFILCDSPAARASNWVRKEREFVESLQGRKVHRIDLAWPWAEQVGAIEDALHSATIFVNSASRDEDRVRPYIELLRKNDFALFNLDTPSAWDHPLESMIETAIWGHFVAFLSTAWANSPYAVTELDRFLELTATMKRPPRPTLVAIDPVQLISPLLSKELLNREIVDLSGSDFIESGRKLLNALGLRASTLGEL